MSYNLQISCDLIWLCLSTLSTTLAVVSTIKLIDTIKKIKFGTQSLRDNIDQRKIRIHAVLLTIQTVCVAAACIPFNWIPDLYYSLEDLLVSVDCCT
jgi:hypothetical protein